MSDRSAKELGLGISPDLKYCSMNVWVYESVSVAKTDTLCAFMTVCVCVCVCVGPGCAHRGDLARGEPTAQL